MSPERKERIINSMKNDENFFLSLNSNGGWKVCLTKYKDEEWARFWNLDIALDSEVFDYYSDSTIIMTIYWDLCEGL